MKPHDSSPPRLVPHRPTASAVAVAGILEGIHRASEAKHRHLISQAGLDSLSPGKLQHLYSECFGARGALRVLPAHARLDGEQLSRLALWLGLSPQALLVFARGVEAPIGVPEAEWSEAAGVLELLIADAASDTAVSP